MMDRIERLPLIILAVVAMLLAAWLARFSIAPAAPSTGVVLVLDRWTGKIELCTGTPGPTGIKSTWCNPIDH
jgi:hypothetical protein